MTCLTLNAFTMFNTNTLVFSVFLLNDMKSSSHPSQVILRPYVKKVTFQDSNHYLSTKKSHHNVSHTPSEYSSNKADRAPCLLVSVRTAGSTKITWEEIKLKVDQL
jgi:hypothetical protein